MVSTALSLNRGRVMSRGNENDVRMLMDVRDWVMCSAALIRLVISIFLVLGIAPQAVA